MTTYSASNWIDGRFVSSSKRSNSINPATYESIGDYADEGGVAAASSITAATRAFRSTDWAHDTELRARVLDQMAAAIERNRDRIIDILSLENGKVRGEAAMEVEGSPSKLRYWAAMARTEAGRAAQPRPGSLSIILRQPMGVAGVIVPWNSPIILGARSFAPALAAGCAVVMKMPGQVAQTAAVLAEVFSEVRDLPNGVMNIFVESGSDGAALLVESPDVPTISFTGSTKTGAAIGAIGAARMKRFGLELGGKAPMIVFDDADVPAMLPVLEKALTVFAGQFCMTGSRLLVQEETFGPVLTLQRFANEAEAITLANDSQYGLSASIWSRDINRALRVAGALEVGSVFVNDWAKVYDGTEEGGFKLSGLGRLNGHAALDDFIEYKHIALHPGLAEASTGPAR